MKVGFPAGLNGLLDALPRVQRDRLLRACEPARLEFGDILCDPARPYSHAWFPQSGLISLVSRLNNASALDMGLIGHEGMLGDTLVLGINSVPMRAVVQASGESIRIPVTSLCRELNRSPALRRVLAGYLYQRVLELSVNGACTRFHQIEQRLARWLLLAHDRTRGDHFRLTHEYLADTLGVRRSGVTVAAGALQARGIISYSRGVIRVVNRPGLEAAACECYAKLNGHLVTGALRNAG